MLKLKLTNTNTKPTTKGVAKKIAPKRGKRSHKRKVESYMDRDVYVPEQRNTSSRGILANATSSFSATASGNVYAPGAKDNYDGLELDANGGIEFRTGDTPAGLFSPDEGESWNLSYTPEHITKTNGDPRVEEYSPERDLATPEPRALDRLFTPDAPEITLTKKVITRFVSDYGKNVPKSAQEGRYAGPSITAVVVKTFVPCYIVQMPKEVRTGIFWYVLFPNGKDKAPRPHFSARTSWKMKPPALLQTCQEIRKEASRLYYSSINVACTLLPNLLPWLQMVDPAARAVIGKIMVPFDPWNHVDKTKEQQIRLCLRQFRKAGIEVKRQKFDLVVLPNDIERSMGGDLTDDE